MGFIPPHAPFPIKSRLKYSCGEVIPEDSSIPVMLGTVRESI